MKKLHDSFTKENIGVWIDYQDIPKSVDWWESIQAGIEHVNVCIVCMSREFLESKVCSEGSRLHDPTPEEDSTYSRR